MPQNHTTDERTAEARRAENRTAANRAAEAELRPQPTEAQAARARADEARAEAQAARRRAESGPEAAEARARARARKQTPEAQTAWAEATAAGAARNRAAEAADRLRWTRGATTPTENDETRAADARAAEARTEAERAWARAADLGGWLAGRAYGREEARAAERAARPLWAEARNRADQAERATRRADQAERRANRTTEELKHDATEAAKRALLRELRTETRAAKRRKTQPDASDLRDLGGEEAAQAAEEATDRRLTDDELGGAIADALCCDEVLAAWATLTELL